MVLSRSSYVFFPLPLKEYTPWHIYGDAVLTGASGLSGVFPPSPSTGNPTETLLHMLKTYC